MTAWSRMSAENCCSWVFLRFLSYVIFVLSGCCSSGLRCFSEKMERERNKTLSLKVKWPFKINCSNKAAVFLHAVWGSCPTQTLYLSAHPKPNASAIARGTRHRWTISTVKIPMVQLNDKYWLIKSLLCTIIRQGHVEIKKKFKVKFPFLGSFPFN